VDSEDVLLVRRCLKKDERAHRELLSKYKRAVYNLAWRMVGEEEDAKDVTQEAFIRAFKSLSTYDTSRPFRTWLFRITTNLCIDYLRRRRAGVQSLDAMRPADEDGWRTADLEDPSPGPDVQHDMAEQRRMLDRLVEALPPRYKVVILLRHGRDLSYNEIAEVLRVPVGTVKARIHRAHNLLRLSLEAEHAKHELQ
jgi:RNA polymerase sigma-70 factor (ECF subfamily)